MHERDLRRQALESGKTVSRKAQSKISSRGSSVANSPRHSRNASRHASDEEDTENLSDGSHWSANSIDDLLSVDSSDDISESWRQDLSDRIDEIIDRKRSSAQGREQALAAYIHFLMIRYANEEIERKVPELLPVLLKSVKAEVTEKETSLALKAIAITLVTCPSETAYDAIFDGLKRSYTTSQSPFVKTAAIHALGAAAVYGGAADSEIEDLMDELLEIIESDGNSIGADDNGDVVVAACEEWGFLATSVDDLEDKTETAMDAFVEQLESSNVNVQVAAGENIALLYEKSYTPREAEDGAASDDSDEDGQSADKGMVKRYDVYRQSNQLTHTLLELANASSKRIAKKDRKALHTNFSDILNTVEHPTRGPRYSNALDEFGKRLGSRLTIRIHKFGHMKIDKWWKLHRLQELRRVLGGGFVVHYQNNEVVFDSLPIMMVGEA